MLTRKQTKPLRANADGARYCASSFFDFLKYKICLNMMLPYNIVHGRDVSMIRKYHNHTLHNNSRYREEGNINSGKTPGPGITMPP